MAEAQNPPPATGGGTMIADPNGAPAAVAAQPSGAMEHGAPSLVGTVLAERYEIVKKLGEGGMGTVYVAKHTTIGKKCAIKVLSSEFAHKQDLVDRFLQEARAASMIAQENVVEITDFGDTPDGSVFFVMEFLAGEDLSDTVKTNGPMPWERVKPIMLQICRALQAAHDAGIIHRDMKPENCFRIKRGKNEDFIKVLDFGIAKVTSEEGEGGKGLTRTGMIFGTPEYMSPEQAQGAKVDHRVDVYATGIIMYELLTGRVPFTADTFMGILTKHMFEVPEAPTQINPDLQIPPDAESIILKALQKDREYRFQSMDEMADAIESVGSGAAGVHVVSENIVRPQTQGQMDFAGGHVPGSTAPPITMPPQGYEDSGGSRSNKGLIFAGIGAVVLAGVGVGIFLAAGNGASADDAMDPAAVAASEKAALAEAEAEAEDDDEDLDEVPVPEPKQKVLDDVVTVEMTIKTPVAAQVLDPADESTYGKSNGDPLKVPKLDEEQVFIIRAEGYEDYELHAVLNRGHKTFDLTSKMVPLPEKKTTSRRKTGSGGKKTGTTSKTSSGSDDPKVKDPVTKDPEPKDKPTPKPIPRPIKSATSPDLKDPFGGR